MAKNKEELLKNYELESNEVIKDGTLYCTKCKNPRMFVNSDNTFATKCLCECQSIAQEEKKELERKKQKMEYFERLRSTSLLGKRYYYADFKLIDESRDNDLMRIVKRCKKYCDNFDKVQKEGMGMYIFGDIGTGKTFLTACIGNELLSKYIPVVFTSFVEISKKLRDTYSNNSKQSESVIIEDLAKVDLLIIDDIGSETVKRNGENTFMQEKIFDVINRRYINQLPTVFTSNYSLEELLDRGVEQRTIDRIAEMSTARFRVQGKSYRSKINNSTKELF